MRDHLVFLSGRAMSLMAAAVVAQIDAPIRLLTIESGDRRRPRPEVQADDHMLAWRRELQRRADQAAWEAEYQRNRPQIEAAEAKRARKAAHRLKHRRDA